jgi:hypothetical protein
LRRIREAPDGAEDTGPGFDAADYPAYLRRVVWPTFGGLAVKAALFAVAILWARGSDIGAAALHGAVGADVFAWIVLTLLDWPTRRFRLTAGLLFEAVLVTVYLQRESLFAISPNPVSTGVSMLFFFIVLVGRTAAWSVARTLSPPDRAMG